MPFMCSLRKTIRYFVDLLSVSSSVWTLDSDKDFFVSEIMAYSDICPDIGINVDPIYPFNLMSWAFESLTEITSASNPLLRELISKALVLHSRLTLICNAKHQRFPRCSNICCSSNMAIRIRGH